MSPHNCSLPSVLILRQQLVTIQASKSAHVSPSAGGGALLLMCCHCDFGIRRSGYKRASFSCGQREHCEDSAWQLGVFSNIRRNHESGTKRQRDCCLRNPAMFLPKDMLSSKSEVVNSKEGKSNLEEEQIEVFDQKEKPTHSHIFYSSVNNEKNFWTTPRVCSHVSDFSCRSPKLRRWWCAK